MPKTTLNKSNPRNLQKSHEMISNISSQEHGNKNANIGFSPNNKDHMKKLQEHTAVQNIELHLQPKILPSQQRPLFFLP